MYEVYRKVKGEWISGLGRVEMWGGLKMSRRDFARSGGIEKVNWDFCGRRGDGKVY